MPRAFTTLNHNRRYVGGLLLVLLLAGPFGFSANFAAADVIPVVATENVRFSQYADRLVDAQTGPISNLSWQNSSNPWTPASYPMYAKLDLGGEYALTSIRYYAGQIAYPNQARVRFEYATESNPESYLPLATGLGPSYDAWSAPIALANPNSPVARYVRVVFDSPEAKFNLAEIEVSGVVDDGPGEVVPITNLSISDEQNSLLAGRLIDQQPPGPSNGDAWQNPAPWDANRYPMSAIIALGGSYPLSRIDYFVGNLTADAEVSFEYTNELNANNFSPLVTVADGHQWNQWRFVSLQNQQARYVRIKFASREKRFNIAEVRLFSTGTTIPQADIEVTLSNGRSTYIPGAATQYQLTLTNNGPASADGANLSAAIPSGLGNVFWTCVGSGGASCDQSNGSGDINQTFASLPAGARLQYTVDGTVAGGHTGAIRFSATATAAGFISDPNPANNNAVDVDTNGDTPISEQPRDAAPPVGMVRAFASWPSAHLSDDCRDLHDRYWVNGPGADQQSNPNHPARAAYQTWHPALAIHPDTGESCDFGHEHGLNPELAPQATFDLFGGWPAFGYAARVAGGPRHEDHVGHKVSVARFRAAIGNGAGSETIYDAGFECDWLSKIHQGSFSMDAFANHLHEYYLALRCFDGLNGDGVVDNTVVGTEFSVKVMYTYGEPNKFVEGNCSGGQTFAPSILQDPNGNPLPSAMQLTPIGNDIPNHRGFVCSSGVLWKQLEIEVPEVDLWTELVKVKHNDGRTALTIQPYYIVKNPARIIEDFDGSIGEVPSKVVRTIDLCYDANGSRENYTYCQDAPDPRPADWIGWRDPRSPFNGTFRAINFKASSQQNGAGPAEFCTTASGHEVSDTPPCDDNHILQYVARFDNNWNNGRYRFGNHTGNVAGSIWAEIPNGARFESTPNGPDGYTPLGLGFEFVIDNRDPDDDMDGFPDGANIRGEN